MIISRGGKYECFAGNSFFDEKLTQPLGSILSRAKTIPATRLGNI